MEQSLGRQVVYTTLLLLHFSISAVFVRASSTSDAASTNRIDSTSVATTDGTGNTQDALTRNTDTTSDTSVSGTFSTESTTEENDSTTGSTGSTKETSTLSSTLDTATDITSSTQETSTTSGSSTPDTVTDIRSTQETSSTSGSSTLDTVTDIISSTQETSTTSGNSTLDTATDINSSTLETPTTSGSSTLDTATDSTGSTLDTATDSTGSTPDKTTDGTGSTFETTADSDMPETTIADTSSTSEVTMENTGNTESTSGTPEMTDITTITSETTGSTGGTSETATDSTDSTIDTTADSTETTYSTDSTHETKPVSTGSTERITADGQTDTETTATTTTTIPTTTTKKYKYPTSPPSLDEAVYVLKFHIMIYGDGNIATEVSSQIVLKFNESFLQQGIKEFMRIKTVIVGEEGGSDSETPLHLEAVFRAQLMASVNSTAFRHNVKEVVEDVTSLSLRANFTINDYTQQLNEILEKSRDVCEASGDLCPDALQVCSSTDQLCVHRCEYKECGEHGYCTVVHGSQPGETQEPDATCQCRQDDGLYERSGETCDINTMKWQYVLAISGGVGGFIILVLVVIIVSVYCRRRSSKYKERLNDVDLDDVYLNDFHRARTLQPADNITELGRLNQSYLPDHTEMYDSNPSGMSFLHNHEATTAAIKKQEEALRSFRPNLRTVDHETDFSIRRPKLVPRASDGL